MAGATGRTPKTKQAIAHKRLDEIGRLIGARPPAQLARLTNDQLGELARLVRESQEIHEAAVAEAEQNVAHIAPRPLRGTIRRLMGSN